MTTDSPPSAAPDGIYEGLDDPVRGLKRWANAIVLMLLGAIVALGLSGALGGRNGEVLALTAPEATLAVETRPTLRNGEFFETRLRVSAARPVGDVVIAISPGVWRDMTINSFIPAPAEEKAEDGAFAFSFGPLDAGKTLDIKIDGQINPASLGGTAGTIALRDGERTLAERPLAIRVLP